MALRLQQKGMTLLEVLVAISLMVVISSISFVALNALINAKNQTDLVASKLRQELLTSQQLNQDIYALLNRSVKDQQGNQLPALLGSYASLELSRNGHVNPLKQNRAELQRVQWILRNNQLFRRSINQLDKGNFPKWQERMYLDDVKDLKISYVNANGIESRVWPTPQGFRIPLRSMQLKIVMKDNSILNFHWSPIL